MPSSPGGPITIHAPIAVGELIDKITILEIKLERIADRERRRNVAAELALLRDVERSAALDPARIAAFAGQLKAVNAQLWEIEDRIRECESRQDFGPAFIELARSVYRNNDRRAALKQEINRAFGSAVVEEKSYKGG